MTGRPRSRLALSAVGAVLVVGAVLFLVTGANRPADPVLKGAPVSTAPGSTTAGRQAVAGFGEIAFRVDRQPGVRRCALLADTPAQRAQGLMRRRDLSGYDGMLFEFPSPTEGQFYMKDTVLPLSIAWFDTNGRLVSTANMTPCLDRGDDCPLYAPAGPYRMALEVPQGGLGRLGVGPGASIAAGGACS